MRSTLLILLLSLAVGGMYLVNARKEPTPAATAVNATKVSEHDWAKHALDRTADLKRQVAQQRKEDGTR